MNIFYPPTVYFSGKIPQPPRCASAHFSLAPDATLKRQRQCATIYLAAWNAQGPNSLLFIPRLEISAMNVRRTAAQREARRRNLRVVHLIVANWLAGALVGAAFASVVIWSDFGGVGRLILRAAPMWPALLLLFGGFAVTFGSIVAGTAIMLIPRDEEPPEDPPDGPLIPVFVAAQGRWRNH